MINVSDPLERLRAVNPVPPAEVDRMPADPVLFHRITTGRTTLAPGAVARPYRARRRARRLVPALVVASLLGGAVAYGVLRDGVTKPQKVACYERADLQANTEVAVVDARGPLAACADLWRQGVLGAGDAVPDLAECVLDSGVAGVFPATPGHDVCAGLGLPPVATAPLSTVPSSAPPPSGPAPPPADPSARILAFRDAVFPLFVDTPCVEPTAAAALVRRELDRAGLGDWTIRGGEGRAGDGFSAERPCATLSLRPEVREVVLVPSPRR
ncbi:MAG: hypothetical protein ACR2KK_09990 [Acidimicrobiales bacterium]